MKVIDICKYESVNKKYFGIPQPMYAYESIAEFAEHERNNKPKVFKNCEELYEYLKMINLVDKVKEYHNLTTYNVWLATNEKFIPDTWTHDNQKIYKTQSGKLIATDNCFIRLYIIYHTPNYFLAFTSTGVYTVSNSSWTVSAAVKTQFMTPLNAKSYDEKYEQMMKNLETAKKPTLKDVRLFHLIFNPISHCFMNIPKAIKTVYGTGIRKADYDRLIQSERFKQVIIMEISAMIPELQKSVVTKIPPDRMADMLKQIFDSSIEKGTPEQQMAVWDKIATIGYGVQTETSPTVTMIGQGTTGNLLGQPTNKVTLTPFEDTDLIPTEEEKVDNLSNPLTEEEKESKLNKLRDSLGSMSGYVDR